MTQDVAQHVERRESYLGRWAPAAFYTLNAILWVVTGVLFEAWDLLWLIVLTIPAISLYVWQTRWSRTFH